MDLCRRQVGGDVEDERGLANALLPSGFFFFFFFFDGRCGYRDFSFFFCVLPWGVTSNLDTIFFIIIFPFPFRETWAGWVHRTDFRWVQLWREKKGGRSSTGSVCTYDSAIKAVPCGIGAAAFETSIRTLYTLVHRFCHLLIYFSATDVGRRVGMGGALGGIP